MQQHTQHPIGGSYFSQAPSLHDCHPRMVLSISSGVVNSSRDGEAERVSDGDRPRFGDGEFRFPSIVYHTSTFAPSTVHGIGELMGLESRVII